MPTRAFAWAICSAQWLTRMVLSPTMPGNTLLRPPEKPANKWGSIKPSASSKSASAATLFSHSSPPEGSFSSCTSDSLFQQSCTTMRTFPYKSGPNFSRSSSSVVPRCKPVATKKVTCAWGLPFWISSNNSGAITCVGTGRVWSLTIITIFFLPRASSCSFGVPTGAAIARRTSSASPASA